jgi:hypothetical protein
LFDCLIVVGGRLLPAGLINRSAVNLVADDRVPAPGEVDADLMLAARSR